MPLSGLDLTRVPVARFVGGLEGMAVATVDRGPKLFDRVPAARLCRWPAREVKTRKAGVREGINRH